MSSGPTWIVIFVLWSDNNYVHTASRRRLCAHVHSPHSSKYEDNEQLVEGNRRIL